MPKNLPTSYIEISSQNLIHNIKQFKRIVKKGTKIAVAIKGNAYGHGQNEIAKIAATYVDYFFVNSIEELSKLRKVSKKKTFLFGYVARADLSKAIKLNAILSLFSFEQLKELDLITTKLKNKIEVHIPIDAHLGREGFLYSDLPKLFEILKKTKYIKVIGIYAHFANIEDTNNFTHAKKQINLFKKAVDLAKTYGYKNLDTHISATSGLLVYEKNLGLNKIVRIGIGAYGLWPSTHIEYLYKKKMVLKPVLSFKTKIALIKTLPAGSTIGYGLTFMTHKETKVAILPIGYADGLDRRMSNKGEVLIRGERCKILGRISMNMTVVDVNYVKDVKVEDEAVFIGSQGKEAISAEEIGETIGTINYEIVTKLSPLLPRVVK
ncbi:MAG: alanine racemase [Candidatus Paceibacterota bacterium]